MTIFTIPPSAHRRALDWMSNNLYEIGRIRQTRNSSYYAEADGRIVESDDRGTRETVGSWREDGVNLIIEIEDY